MSNKRKMVPAQCIECGSPFLTINSARGTMCSRTCRMRRRHRENPDTPEKREARFWAKVDKTSACWLWTGAKTNAGYGHLRIEGVDLLAHRHSYTLMVGEIPHGLTLDHLCRTPLCVNPEHLEPVTLAENSRRANAARTTCRYGHEFDDAYVNTRGQVIRRCKTCVRRRDQAYAARKRGAA